MVRLLDVFADSKNSWKLLLDSKVNRDFYDEPRCFVPHFRPLPIHDHKLLEKKTGTVNADVVGSALYLSLFGFSGQAKTSKDKQSIPPHYFEFNSY